MDNYIEQSLLVTDPNSQLVSQWRLCEVQVLNWGRFHSDVQRVQFGRKGAAVLGPSGGGKSMLLDAISSVIFPNPQKFNQAARDDGGKSERTIYTYVRGLTDHRRDSNGHTTPNYLRPAGKGAFPSGVAVTFENGQAERATAIRLMWVSSDASDQATINNATVYGFVHGDFDLTSLNGLRGARPGSSPISPGILEGLVDTARGDVFHPSQERIHARMRDVLGLGANDQSQRLALDLMRRALASKGVPDINALFKSYVLTEPDALTRWDATLETYQEAVKLYGEYETARKRFDALSGLPEKAEQYAKAASGHSGKLALLGRSQGASRLELWHAVHAHDWCERTLEDKTLDLGIARDEQSTAKAKLTAATETCNSIQAMLAAAGGDSSQHLQSELQRHTDARSRILETRDGFGRRLAEFGKTLPDSAGDLELLRHDLQLVKAAAAKTRDDKEAAVTKESVAASQKDGKVTELDKELKRLLASGSNIPGDADARRLLIARGVGLKAKDLPYVGELIQVGGEHKRWEHAIANLLYPLARRILVDEGHYEQVRQFIHDNQMNGEVVLQRAWTNRQRAIAIPSGTIAEMIDIDAGTPFRAWIAAELAEHANYLPGTSTSDLDRRPPAGVRGYLLANGMRSVNPDQVIKNDLRRTYTWIGWDNQQTRLDLQAERESALREARLAHTARQAAVQDRDDAVRRIDRLDRIASDLTWEKIDLGVVDALVGDATAALAEAETPEATGLRKRLKAAEESQLTAAISNRDANLAVADLEAMIEQLYEAKGPLWDTIRQQDELTQDESALLAELAFGTPSSVDQLGDSLHQAENALREQIARHSEQRDDVAATIVAIIRGYGVVDEEFARESSGDIEALPSALDIYRQLKTDDLPSTRTRWLSKVTTELDQQLKMLLSQIDSDSREIRKGLAPIRSVLANVSFRDRSTLDIEARPRPTAELRNLQKVINQYTEGSIGHALEPEDVEKAFLTLMRGLAKLNESSRSGDRWRRLAFDAREHFEFQAIEKQAEGTVVIHDGVSGMSGGEGQELIAFILGSALRYRLSEGSDRVPTYGTIMLDEGFVKSDGDFTSRSLEALTSLGFHIIIGAPREKANAFEDHVESVVYLCKQRTDQNRIRMYSIGISEAVAAGYEFNDDEAA